MFNCVNAYETYLELPVKSSLYIYTHEMLWTIIGKAYKYTKLVIVQSVYVVISAQCTNEKRKTIPTKT